MEKTGATCSDRRGHVWEEGKPEEATEGEVMVVAEMAQAENRVVAMAVGAASSAMVVHTAVAEKASAMTVPYSSEAAESEAMYLYCS